MGRAAGGAGMIRLNNVRKVYHTRSGDNVVLDGVGFDHAIGRASRRAGRNGAGKSTMVRLISGAERPNLGHRRAAHVGVLAAAFGGRSKPTLSGIDNIRFISRIYAQDFQRNLAFVADFSELGTYLREPVRSYSSGMAGAARLRDFDDHRIRLFPDRRDRRGRRRALPRSLQS